MAHTKGDILALSINNDGQTYNQRLHIGAVSFSRANDALQRMKELAREVAKLERQAFKAKYSIRDVNDAAAHALEYVREHQLGLMREKVASGRPVYVRGRKWFDKTYGNTYHSVFMDVAGVSVYLPMQYGYGTQWQTTATDWLVKNGFFADRETADKYVTWGDCPEGLKKYL